MHVLGLLLVSSFVFLLNVILNLCLEELGDQFPASEAAVAVIRQNHRDSVERDARPVALGEAGRNHATEVIDLLHIIRF